MKKGLWPVIVVLLTLAVPLPTMAQQKAVPGDARILAAREALRTGDRKTLERLAASREDHALDPYVRYWLLLNKLARPEAPPAGELLAYLRENAGSLTAERLEATWLRRLAKDNDWQGFLQRYRAYTHADDELRCQAWNARLHLGDPTLFAEVRSQWLQLVDAHEACLPLLQSLAASGQLSEEELWWRFRRQIDSRKPEAALRTLAWLPGKVAAQKTQFERAIKSPQAFINHLPANFSATRSGREQALTALVRLAREDPQAAYKQFSRLNDRFSHEERAYMYVLLGYHAALWRLPEALAWYRAASDTLMTDAQRDWRIRAALRVEDWQHVKSFIEALPEDQRERPEWIYWYARALRADRQLDEARRQFARIADDTDFYGLLAAAELGRRFSLQPPAAPATDDDKARVANDPALQRALAFYRLNIRIEAVREWLQAVRGKDRGFLLAAAELALENDLYDRAINTAELADPRDNFELRFILPYRSLIEPQVRQQNLDLAWVYGLMRQESRFIVPARSGAGAQGLMQVMPATGKWVAQQIGMKDYQPKMLSEPDTNVLLGTHYMRLILQGLDNHPVLASVGYNAGPGRARRWRDDKPLEAAIYIETIPIDETRDYVKKVLANSVVYAAILDGSSQSIKDRLGFIAPATKS